MIGLIAYLVHRKLKAKAPEDPHMHKKVSILDFYQLENSVFADTFFSFFSNPLLISLVLLAIFSLGSWQRRFCLPLANLQACEDCHSILEKPRLA